MHRLLEVINSKLVHTVAYIVAPEASGHINELIIKGECEAGVFKSLLGVELTFGRSSVISLN